MGSGEEAMAGVIAFAVLCAFYLGPWQRGWADFARQRVFEERDAIFDMALRGELEFDSEIYEATRASMNSLIRFAHRVTFPRLVFFGLLGEKMPNGEGGPIRSTISNDIKDLNVRSKVLKCLDAAEDAMVTSLICRSCISFFLIVVAFYMRIIYRRLLGNQSNTFRNVLLKRVEVDALYG